METILLVVVIVLITAIGILLVRRGGNGIDADKVLNQLYEKNEELRSKNKDEVNSSVKDMLEGNQKQIDTIVKQLHTQLKESQGSVSSLKEQNAALQQAIHNTNDMTKELKTSTDSLKNLLSNNRLRGEWGEQVAEDLLLGAGFVENLNFTKQSSSGEGRPDFTIKMPDGTKLNVDAKFPFDDLVVYQEAKTEIEKKTALKNFERAVKNKVKQVTSKDYINPESGTVDFVVMFIPNEMIFSFIYEKLPDMSNYMNAQKVIMTGPFGFTALIRLVLQAYKNFQYEQGLHEILGLIEKFQGEYEKFGESMAKLGKQIDTTRITFGEVEGTRNRQLGRVVEKISEYSRQEKLLTEEEPTIKLGDKE